MFYIIETNYVGPNSDQHADADEVRIQTEPGRTNSSHQERTEGWLGTTNDWAQYARGEYETEDAARAAIEELFGECRERAVGSDPVNDDPDGCVVAVFKVGKYEPMSREWTAGWITPGLQSDVTADTTDEQLEALIEEWEGACNGEGYTLDSRAIDMAREYRDELIASRDEQDDES